MKILAVYYLIMAIFYAIIYFLSKRETGKDNPCEHRTCSIGFIDFKTSNLFKTWTGNYRRWLYVLPSLNITISDLYIQVGSNFLVWGLHFQINLKKKKA